MEGEVSADSAGALRSRGVGGGGGGVGRIQGTEKVLPFTWRADSPSL